MGKRVKDEQVDRLLEALRKGHYVDEACEYARMSRQTYYRWIREAEAADSKHERGETLTPREDEVRYLRDALKEAEVSGQNIALDKIHEAIANGTWQAAAWFMERRNKKWSNRTEVTGSNGGPVETVSVDELDAKLMGMIDAARASEAERESRTGTPDSHR
jgi:transposase-like protein